MHHCYFYIVNLLLENFRENALKKSIFVVPINCLQKHEDAYDVKMPVPEQRTCDCVMLTSMHVTVDKFNFFNGPRMHICSQKSTLNSIPLASLIHGFVLVKSCLFIACDTTFNAIKKWVYLGIWMPR